MGPRSTSLAFSLFPAQAVHPGLAGRVLLRTGFQLPGQVLHRHQPLQHGQADQLPGRIALAVLRSGKPRSQGCQDRRSLKLPSGEGQSGRVGGQYHVYTALF